MKTKQSSVTNHHFQEETDWEGGSNDADDSEDDDDEEIKAGTSGLRPPAGAVAAREVFPVLAPPEQFQNCLSPSATYEVRIDESLAPAETSDLTDIFSEPGQTECGQPRLQQRQRQLHDELLHHHGEVSQVLRQGPDPLHPR